MPHRRFTALRRSDGHRPPLHVGLVLLATVLLLTNTCPASAQVADITVAPAVTPATPPVAQPVDQTESAPPSDTSTNAPTGGQPGAGLIVTTPAEARFDSAMTVFNAGQYADAVTAFSDFVRDFPQDRRREEALYRLAESYRNLGRTDDALAAYTFQVQTYPDGPLRTNGELRRGAILFDAGKFADAVAPLQVVVDKGDGELRQIGTYLLGRSFLATQKEAEGRALLQGLIDRQPPGKFAGNAAQALAELDDSQAHYPEALLYWQKAYTLFSPGQNSDLLATIAARGGWSALQANQPAAAEKFFGEAIVLNGLNKGDTLKVAATGTLRLRFQQKRFADWVAFYQVYKGNLLDSARAEILYDLGHAQFSLKHWPEAVAGFDQYLGAFGTQDAAVTAAYERFLALTQIDRTKTAGEAEAYLKAWPKSPYRARVQLLQAQELSREKNFSAALPLWESLAGETGDASWPHQDILLELARAYDELSDFPKAATAYQAYLDDLTSHPGNDKQAQARNVLRTQARLAICLQKADQLLAATDAWKAVQALAPEGSREQQTALESLGLIYARGGPAQETAMVAIFHALLEKFPQSPLRAMAAFSVGDSLFKNRDYAGAEPLLLEARNWDAKTWLQPATQRLVLGAYGEKNYDKTVAYVKEYDTIPLPADPRAQNAARIPAALFYWLAESARQAGKWDEAEIYYSHVTQHPDPGDLLAGAWWQLGEVESHRKEWPAAVASYEKYRQLKPEAGNATTVLLALGRAELGAKDFDAAKKLGEQALLQEPEGPRSAAARMLLGETAFATQSYAEAARMFATLAVLFDDPQITPQAISRAADAFERAGDAKSAADWRQKMKDKYPQYQPSSYL
ncbi:MAG: tetratricopeptide repeat protein [Methylacidiphilales bacterium]|nr:tetratricopeptide repeat protein [Candidatus Methylacidiphilales bacterium]